MIFYIFLLYFIHIGIAYKDVRSVLPTNWRVLRGFPDAKQKEIGQTWENGVRTRLRDSSRSYEVQLHPLEPKVAYISGLKNIRNIKSRTLNNLKLLFQKHPLLIFQNIEKMTKADFITFLSHFDEDHDKESLAQYISKSCETPGLRDSTEPELDDLSMKNEVRKNLRGSTSNPATSSQINVVKGLYMYKTPNVGEGTHFISSETIYSELGEKDKIALQHMVISYDEKKYPFVIMPDNSYEKKRIHPNAILPHLSDFSRHSIAQIMGWSVNDTRIWLDYFITNHVLPYHVYIQWRKGDLCVYNNRRWLLSSTEPKTERISGCEAAGNRTNVGERSSNTFIPYDHILPKKHYIEQFWENFAIKKPLDPNVIQNEKFNRAKDRVEQSNSKEFKLITHDISTNYDNIDSGIDLTIQKPKKYLKNKIHSNSSLTILSENVPFYPLLNLSNFSENETFSEKIQTYYEAHIPTKRLLYGIVPNNDDLYSCMHSAYYNNWIHTKSLAFASYNEFRKYYISRIDNTTQSRYII